SLAPTCPGTYTLSLHDALPIFPASVKAAIKPTNQPPNWTLASNAPAAPATQVAAVVTPRLADGHPDMTGNWGGPPLVITGSGTRDRKSTRLNSSHRTTSYAVFC